GIAQPSFRQIISGSIARPRAAAAKFEALTRFRETSPGVPRRYRLERDLSQGEVLMGHIVRTLAILSCLASAAVADVGKEELKKLVLAGLSDELIVNYVRYKGPLARLSAEDLIELKKSGLGDALLVKLLPMQEPQPEGASSPQPASTAAATAKLLSDPDIIYDGRAFYPRSYFSSIAPSSSSAIGFTLVNPGWYGACAVRTGFRWSHGWSAPYVRTGFGSCGSGGSRVCTR